jgi:hypothetical protein
MYLGRRSRPTPATFSDSESLGIVGGVQNDRLLHRLPGCLFAVGKYLVIREQMAPCPELPIVELIDQDGTYGHREASLSFHASKRPGKTARLFVQFIGAPTPGRKIACPAGHNEAEAIRCYRSPIVTGQRIATLVVGR